MDDPLISLNLGLNFVPIFPKFPTWISRSGRDKLCPVPFGKFPSRGSSTYISRHPFIYQLLQYALKKCVSGEIRTCYSFQTGDPFSTVWQNFYDSQDTAYNHKRTIIFPWVLLRATLLDVFKNQCCCNHVHTGQFVKLFSIGDSFS